MLLVSISILSILVDLFRVLVLLCFDPLELHCFYWFILSCLIFGFCYNFHFKKKFKKMSCSSCPRNFPIWMHFFKFLYIGIWPLALFGCCCEVLFNKALIRSFFFITLQFSVFYFSFFLILFLMLRSLWIEIRSLIFLVIFCQLLIGYDFVSVGGKFKFSWSN